MNSSDTPEEPDPLLVELRRILQDHLTTRFKNKVDDLAKAISDASGQYKFKPGTLNVLLGKAVRDRKDLDTKEICALHAYLTKHCGGGGFVTLLGGHTLLESVAAHGSVVFILPSKRLGETTAIIHWDLLAMMAIVDALRAINPSVQIRIENQLKLEEGEKPEDETWAEFFEKQSWHKYLKDGEAPSLICIGSPRANHASEVLLAKMFNDTTPFSPPAISDSLPFRFYWKPKPELGLPSSFTAQEEDVGKHLGDAYKTRCPYSALLVQPTHGHPLGYSVSYGTGATSWETYAVVCAQRRREGGGIWIVVSGLEGPASLGAAQKLGSLGPLSLGPPGQQLPPKRHFLTIKVIRRPSLGTTGQDSRDLDPNYKNLNEERDWEF